MELENTPNVSALTSNHSRLDSSPLPTTFTLHWICKIVQSTYLKQLLSRINNMHKDTKMQGKSTDKWQYNEWISITSTPLTIHLLPPTSRCYRSLLSSIRMDTYMYFFTNESIGWATRPNKTGKLDRIIWRLTIFSFSFFP